MDVLPSPHAPTCSSVRFPRTIAACRRLPVWRPVRKHRVSKILRDLLTSAGRRWLEFPLDQRQRLQTILFPKGLTYGSGSFEPAETSVIFRMSHAIEAGKSRKATLTVLSLNQTAEWLREVAPFKLGLAA